MKKTNILLISVASILAIYFYNLNLQAPSELISEEAMVKQVKAVKSHDHNHEDTHKSSIVVSKNTQKRSVQSVEANELPKLKKDYSEEIRKIDRVAKAKNFKDKLFNVVVSKNPYKNTLREHNTLNARLFQQEAALRVHAMKHLDSLLKAEAKDYKATFNQIIQTADDNTLKVIAQEAIEYHERGRSVFKDAPKGVRQLPVPE